MSAFKFVRMAIIQPRVSKKPSEFDCTVEELEAWARAEAVAAVKRRQEAADSDLTLETGWADAFLNPGEKQCKFCKAKASNRGICPKLRDDVFDAVSIEAASPEDFIQASPTPISSTQDPAWLAAVQSKVDLIEDWCKAVRAESERRLLAGEALPGWKLVQGKRGARKWINDQEAEATLKGMRLKVDEMYDFKLISPTTAEKLRASGALGLRQWTKLQAFITQSEGKPHVAPSTDPRPAIEIRPVADDFEDMTDASQFA